MRSAFWGLDSWSQPSPVTRNMKESSRIFTEPSPHGRTLGAFNEAGDIPLIPQFFGRAGRKGIGCDAPNKQGIRVSLRPRH